MTAAVRAAADDAGAPGLLGAVDCIAVPQGSWSLTDPARTVARRIGSPRARTIRFEVGVSQQEVINHALAAVAAGDYGTVVVVGGEARRWARDGGSETDEEGAPPDEVVTRPPDFVAPIERAAGIVLPPVQQYALIENALGGRGRADAGRAARRDRRAVGPLQRGRPRQPRGRVRRSRADAAEIATPGPRQPAAGVPLQQVARQPVDRGPVVGPRDLLGRRGPAPPASPPDRWLFPHVALHCSAAVTLTARRRLSAWPAMARARPRRRSATSAGPCASIELAEVYSCFPAAVRVQQRELGLDPAGTPTLTGGMTFAGGPFNHFVLQSLVALGRRLRAGRAGRALGLVTTVSGMLSKPGLAVWSADPPAGARRPLPPGRPGRRGDGRHRGRPGASTPGPASPRRPRWPPSPSPTAAPTASSRSARPSSPTCPMGCARPPPAKMQHTARLAVAEGLIGRAVEVKDTTFSL